MKTVDAAACVPMADALGRAFKLLGKRWNAVVLGHLSHGPAGFRDLSRDVIENGRQSWDDSTNRQGPEVSSAEFTPRERR